MTTFFSTYILPAIIAIIMLGIGLTLKLNDFKNIFLFPRPLIIGLICQMIVLPIIAFGVAYLVNFPPEIKVGLIIIAASPGGATANYINHLLKNNVALSISLTIVNSILTLISIPIIVYIALRLFMEEAIIIRLPILPTITKIFVMTAIPASLGILIKEKLPKVAHLLENPLKYGSLILLAAVYSMAFFGSYTSTEENIIKIYREVTPLVLLLNVIIMCTGYYFPKVSGVNKVNSLTLAIEIGIHNSSLAITIAASPLFLNNFTMAIPATIYGIFTFFTAIIFGLIIKNLKERI